MPNQWQRLARACSTPSLLRSATGSGVLGVCHKILNLLAAVVLGRALGAEGYGFYAFAVAAVTFIAIPAQLGLPQLVIREVAAMHSRREWTALRGFRRRVIQASILSIVVGTGLGAAFLLLADRIPALHPLTFAIALLLLPLQIGTAIVSSLLSGLRRVLQAMWPSSLFTPTLFLVLLLLLRSRLTSELAAALSVGATLFALLITARLLVDYWPTEARQAAPAYRTRHWISSVLPFTLLVGVNVLNTKTDLLMLGFFGSASDVGIYNVAVQGAMLVSFPLAAINAVLAPEIARFHAEKQTGELQELMTRFTLAMLLCAATVALVLLVSGRWLLGFIFGATFESGYTALVILALGQLVNALAGPVGLFLSMTGHEKDTLRGITASAVLNVLLNAALIPPFGLVGAAIATTVSVVAWNILLGALVYQRLGLVPGPFTRSRS